MVNRVSVSVDSSDGLCPRLSATKSPVDPCVNITNSGSAKIEIAIMTESKGNQHFL